MQPFIDSRVRRIFERQIARALMRPNLFHPELLPMHRLFCFYGQPGSGLDDAVHSLLKEYDIQFDEFTATRDPAPIRRAFELAAREDVPKVPVLWIRKGHVLQYHRELFLQSLELAETVKRNLFVIVTGEEIPDREHPFYEQFEVVQATGLPNQQYHRKLMQFYFDEWKAYWTQSEMKLTDDDLDWLAVSCDFCTPLDVELFVQKVFRHVQEAYPEQKVDITRELLEDKNNRFMYESLGVAGIYCITDRDAQALQLKYDPEGATTAPSVQEASERETKRQKKSSE
jgi:hypothetical protein